jgi:hypothetical protein
MPFNLLALSVAGTQVDFCVVNFAPLGRCVLKIRVINTFLKPNTQDLKPGPSNGFGSKFNKKHSILTKLDFLYICFLNIDVL